MDDVDDLDEFYRQQRHEDSDDDEMSSTSEEEVENDDVEDDEATEEEDGAGAGTSRKRKKSRVSSRKETVKKTKRRKKSGAAAGKPKQSKAKAIIREPKERKKPIRLADKELDPVNMSLKEIVKWGGARERKMATKEKIERQKAIAAAHAAGEELGDDDATHGGGAGPSGAQTTTTITTTATTTITTTVSPNTNLQTRPLSATTGGLASPISSPAAAAVAATAAIAAAGPRHPNNNNNVALAPQVQVIDGRIVVNRKSLVVQAQEREQYTRVVTEDSSRLNSMTYMNRISNARWTAEDTELFYKALSQFGTDFTLITHLFPGRERSHLKNKYTRESKLNSGRVDEAIRASAHATINSYKEMIAMLKESGMNVGDSGGGVDGDGGAAAIGGEGSGGAAAPLAITEAGEPPDDPSPAAV